MSGGFTPSHREDIPRVVFAPVIERPPPAVKLDEDGVVLGLPYRCGADEVRIFAVHGLQLHANLELVAPGIGRFLKDEGEKRDENTATPKELFPTLLYIH